MTREIISEEDGFGIFVNTFWNGKEEGVQITIDSSHIRMTRTEARRLFLFAYNRLSAQVLDDEENPPWWRDIDYTGPFSTRAEVKSK